jgi:D-lactate dehydrogenase (cytochrome)
LIFQLTKDYIFCQSVNVIFLGLDSFENVQQVFIEAKKELGEILSAFEFLDRISLELVVKVKHVRKPLNNDYKFYVLVETAGSNPDHDREVLF